MSYDWIVGVDPSSNTGFVVMDELCKVQTEMEINLKSPMKASTEQILQYGRSIVHMIPDNSRICIEGFSLGSTGQAVSLMFAIGFAIRYELIDQGIDYLEVTPTGLKKFVAGTGKGNAKKEIIIKEVYKRWGYEHASNNVIDAYALARYAISTME